MLPGTHACDSIGIHPEGFPSVGLPLSVVVQMQCKCGLRGRMTVRGKGGMRGKGQTSTFMSGLGHLGSVLASPSSSCRMH